MNGHKLRDLPGWAQASVEASTSVRHDGSTYNDRIGDWLRIIGAFVAPPSVDHVTTELVRGMLLGLQRQWWIKWTKDELAKLESEKVIDFGQARRRLYILRDRRRLLRGDWSDHYGTRDLERSLTDHLVAEPEGSLAMLMRRRARESAKDGAE